MAETDAFASLYGRLAATTLAPGRAIGKVTPVAPAGQADRPSALLARLAPLRPKPVRRRPTWHPD